MFFLFIISFFGAQTSTKFLPRLPSSDKVQRIRCVPFPNKNPGLIVMEVQPRGGLVCRRHRTGTAGHGRERPAHLLGRVPTALCSFAFDGYKYAKLPTVASSFLLLKVSWPEFSFPEFTDLNPFTSEKLPAFFFYHFMTHPLWILPSEHKAFITVDVWVML